ncbi:kelch repeat-containing protein [Amycolatopsis sp. NPDC021455]|uniref:kelch repeat-containing protein n=1 Tax=Amycolatopsis sp. NPDC021455 TaxID=3154901 RepID=UPI0033C836A5
MTDPTGDRGTLGLIAHHLVEALRPLEDAFSDPAAFTTLMRQLGWRVPGLPPSYPAVAAAVTQAVNALELLAGDAGAEEILAVVGKAGDVYRAISALTQAPAGIDPAVFLPGLARRLFEYLLGRQLLAEAPDWYAGLEALGIIAPEFQPAAAGRADHVRVRFDWDRIPALLADPSPVPAAVYGWGTPNLAFGKLAELLAGLVAGLGLPVTFDQLSDDEIAPLHAEATQPPDETAGQGLTLTVGEIALPDGTVAPIGLQLTGLPADGAALPGVILLPQVPDGVDAAVPLGGHWSLVVRAGTDLARQLAVFARPGDVGVRYPGAPGQPLPSAGFGVSLVFAPDTAVRLFGQPGQTRLELTGAKLEAAVDVRGGEPELGFRAIVDGLALVIATAGADGFLATLLGDTELRVAIPAELAWSSRSGLRFATQAGLEVTANPDLDLGFTHVDRVTLAVKADGTALATRAQAAFSGTFGPFSYVVDGFGVELPVAFADGNAGPFDVGLRVTPPTGVGLAVDAGVISGGGFLSFDAGRGEYAGALELELADFVAVKAIGVISTRQADGSRGFSLLIVLTAEFGTGLQLGAGFTLLAVGGLVGLNRGMNLAALVEGVRTGAIESVAFPKDVVANAPRILSDLAKYFPPEQGTFLIGPMAKIGWGTPTLVTVSLGVIIEIPGTIAVLGVLKAALPNADKPLLVVQAQFVGALELDKSRLWFFAKLFDSRILTMPIDGGMGVLVAWGDNPDLVLTVGGFHPAYRPPPLPFPIPDRLSVDILNRSNQLIRVAGYFAITSNTVQFGAKAELRLGFSAFRVEGHLGFDALFQLSPFRFAIHIHAHVTLKAFGVGAFGIDLDFQLEGPAPWRAHGRGTIGFLFFSISANFDITWGEDRDTTLPSVAVLPLLANEIGKTEGWETRLPSGGNRALVNLRDLPETGEIVLHPLGTLFVRQRALPLNVRLDRVGGRKAGDGKRFTVAPVDNTGLKRVSDTGDRFAMGQFQTLSDADALSRPSYETQDAGLELTADTALATARVVRRSARYELHVIDSTATAASPRAATLAGPQKRFHSVSGPVFDELTKGSSTSRAALSARQATQKQPFATQDTVRVTEQRFVVAYRKSNRQAFPPARPGRRARAAAATFRSRATAEDALADFVTADRTLDGLLHVIPVAEAAAPPAASGTWSDAGPLPVPASWTDLATLADGRVLLAGGTGPDGAPLAATALFDPTADAWSAGPSLATGRRGHTTTRLGNGRVLALGGRSRAGVLASAEIFDPAAGAWAAAAAMSTARHGHTATALPDGRILVTGGSGVRTGQEDGALASAELFQPATGTWTAAAPMGDARTGHQAVVLDDGRVLVVGGAVPTGNGRDEALAHCELYDPDKDEWTPTGTLSQARKGHQATVLPTGRVLVTGGDPVVAGDGTLDPHSLATAELFDPATQRWSAAADMPGGGRARHRHLRLRSELVLVLGGTGAPEATAGFRSVLAYDHTDGSWSTVDGLGTGRSGFGSVELADDRVLVAGGVASAGAAAENPEAGTPAQRSEVLIP